MGSLLGAVLGVVVAYAQRHVVSPLFFFFLTLVIGPRRSLSLNLSDTKVYAP